MSNDVKLKYEEWEKILRQFIKKSEDVKDYNAIEVAKSLLLYGMKLYNDLITSNLGEKDRLSFVNEMRRRTALVLQHVMSRPKSNDEIIYAPKFD